MSEEMGTMVVVGNDDIVVLDVPIPLRNKLQATPNVEKLIVGRSACQGKLLLNIQALVDHYKDHDQVVKRIEFLVCAWEMLCDHNQGKLTKVVDVIAEDTSHYKVQAFEVDMRNLKSVGDEGK